jgi:hypothetical protein
MASEAVLAHKFSLFVILQLFQVSGGAAVSTWLALLPTNASSSTLHALVPTLMHAFTRTSKPAMHELGTKYVAHMSKVDSDTSYHAYVPRCYNIHVRHPCACAALAKKAPHMAQLRPRIYIQ